MDQAYKQAFAKREAEQETAAFMSDPDLFPEKYQHSKSIPKQTTKDEDQDDMSPEQRKVAKSLERKLSTVEEIKKYMLAGKAIFTLRSKTTGTRFTFKVVKPKKENHNPRSPYPYDDNIWFVRVMTGPDNTAHYSYMGIIKRKFEDSVAYPDCKITVWSFCLTARTAPQIASAPSAKAFGWFFEKLDKQNHVPTTMEFWHSGRCGRCSKLLTVPKSIAQGLGPECASKGF